MIHPRRLFAGVLAACVAGVAAAQPQPQPIVIGLTAPLSGHDAAYGQGLQHGAQLAVARANAAGGLAGRTLELLALDDAGDPSRAAANARELLQRGAVALTGVHGARATLAVAEVLVPAGSEGPVAALVAPATSADLLRDPPRPGVFHLRAGASEEAAAAVLHLDTLGITRYALLLQADALGDSGRDAMVFELTRIAIRPEARERLAAGASTAEVQRAVAKLCAAQPEALILAVEAGPAAAALAAARAQRCAAHAFVFSETGAVLAARPPGATGPHPLAGLLVTQVVPHPSQMLHPLVAEYQRAAAAQRVAAGGYASLEAYLATRVILEGLRACGREAGRACLLRTLATRSLDLPGLKVQFGSGQRQPRPFVDITLLDAEGRFRH